MAAASIPVSLQSVLSLSSLGIAREDISFKTVTVTSDKAIAVRRTQPAPAISLVDLASGRIVNTLNVSADWAVLSADARILAVRVGNAVQLQNIVDSKKIKGTRMPDGDAITFMKFVSATLLVIVTASAVYSWDAADASTAPTKVCERHASLGGAQVIDVAVSFDA
jgi:clathrin heavy chain